MKKFLLAFTITVAVTASSFAATCVGATPCRACSTCEYCKRCAKQGGTCGVCAGHHVGNKKTAKGCCSKPKAIVQR